MISNDVGNINKCFRIVAAGMTWCTRKQRRTISYTYNMFYRYYSCQQRVFTLHVVGRVAASETLTFPTCAQEVIF